MHTWMMNHTAADDSSVLYEYQSPKMPVLIQAEVLRRVAPPLAAKMAEVFQGSVDQAAAFRSGIIAAIAAIGDIKKEDYDFTVNALMSGVKRRKADTSDAFAPVWNSGAKRMMFDDIELMQLYRIMQEVGEYTYGNFISLISQTFPTSTSIDEVPSSSPS